MTTSRTSRRQHNAPTINDVAKHAGVSPMTVSRVINDEQTVRPTTREKVKASIAALNYSPSVAARSLAGGEETRIGLLYSNPSSSYLSEFLMGSLDQAARSGVHLVVEKFGDDMSVAAVMQQLKSGRISGIILPPPLCDSQEMLDALAKAAIPAVAVATGRAPSDMLAVSIDDFQAAYEMTQHLITLGHSRIGFIKGNPNLSASDRRFEGYRAALTEAGIADDPSLCAQGYFTYRSGLDAAETILDRPNRPSAIFASNDDMAAATVAVAHRRGMDVPSDLTVCGFDDTPLATTIWPELTTIHQPIGEMSRVAVEMLVREMRGRPKPGADTAETHVMLDYSLVRRQSDAAPRMRPKA
ncbi:MAG: LacI family DNA-binding transcriptional regulator [Pseudomonadota bacterium]